MTPKEIIRELANQYFSEYANNNLQDAPDFYDYLLKNGFTRHQLSALGIGRDLKAGTAQSWRGDQLS